MPAHMTFVFAQTNDLFCATDQDNMEREVDSYLRRKYENSIRDIEVVHKEDLDLVRLISLLRSVTGCNGICDA